MRNVTVALLCAVALPLPSLASSNAVAPTPVATVAAPDSLARLNAAIADLLKPLNTPVSKAALVFYAVKTNAERAVEASVGISYERSGKKNRLVIKPQTAAKPTASYGYAEDAGARPVTTVNVEFEYDLLKMFSQQRLNQLGPSANELAESFARDFGKEYGAAATISAEPPAVVRDAKGDIESLSMTLGAAIDLAKLPATIKAEDVPFTEIQASLAIGRRGGGLFARVASNPAGKSFQRGQTGLKEMLDKLVARDPAEMRRASGWIGTIHQFAAYLVD